MGGNFFFNDDEHKHIVFTDNEESSDILTDDEFPENGLKRALIMHLISSAHIFLNDGIVCNFLIHPSVKTAFHKKFAEKIGNYLNEISHSHEEDDTREAFRAEYDKLHETKANLADFDLIYDTIYSYLQEDKINILVLNSTSSFEENTQYEKGINVLVGGNSLGRGVTFPQLQTIYYCRVAKSPQADTMWQHARMFGYDRDPDLLRVFMPPKLYKLFSDINRTNNNIIAQIETTDNGNDIKIIYPKGLKPTRKNVLDNKIVGIYTGGVNYFPFYPINTDIVVLDNILSSFEDDEYTVSLNIIIKILEQTGSEENDWDKDAFIGFIQAFLSEKPIKQGKLIVRRNRDIARGTGTLLSPNDRKLGEQFSDAVVLTVYKITGNKGWNGQQIWYPNIKLPGTDVYYSGDKSPK